MSATQNDTPPGAPPRGRLQRSKSDRVLAGVCGGLGEYFDVDPVIFRIAFVVLAFVGGAGILLYPVAWLLLPEDGHQRSIGEGWVQRGRRGHVLPIVLIVIGALILSGDLLSRHHDGGIGFAVIAIVVGALLLRRHPSAPPQPPSTSTPWSTPPAPTPPAPPPPAGTNDTAQLPATDATAALPPPPESPPPPAPPSCGGGASWGPPAGELRPTGGRSLTAIVLSILLISAGAVGLLHAADVVSVSVPVFLAGALILVGVSLVVSAWTGGTSGLIAIGVVLTIALVIASVVRVPLSGGWGEKRWVPNSAEEVRTFYKHGAGDVVIDLSHVTFPAEGQLVRARLGAGHMKVVVPAGARVSVTAHAGAGDLFLFGRHENGIDVDDSATTGPGAQGTLRLHLDVGAGQVEVVSSESLLAPLPFTPFTPSPPSPPTTVAVPQ
jgi:phage shock protein PspC (stress-responsive transcriptional regulator)